MSCVRAARGDTGGLTMMSYQTEGRITALLFVVAGLYLVTVLAFIGTVAGAFLMKCGG